METAAVVTAAPGEKVEGVCLAGGRAEKEESWVAVAAAPATVGGEAAV